MNRNFAKNFVFDAPVEAVRDIRRMNRAQKRHNDVVAATHKREIYRKNVERCIEDGPYFHFPKREQALSRLNQPNRWATKKSWTSAGQRNYHPSWEIEKQNVFEKADRRAEKYDEKRDIAFNQYLTECDDADRLLDEYWDFVKKMVTRRKEWKTVYEDGNDPGTFYVVAEVVEKQFLRHMNEEGACMNNVNSSYYTDPETVFYSEVFIKPYRKGFRFE